MTVSGFDFSGDAPGAYNLGGFLGYGGTLDSISYMNGASTSTDVDNTLWEFTGTADFVTGTTFYFDFIYTECCGGTANFQTTLVPIDTSPEPSTRVLFSVSGAVLLFGFRKRIRRSP